jgi:large subunit ribosomal protein L25
MSALTLEATKRETGKKASKAVRKSGLIPGVFYAKGKEPLPIATTLKQLRPAVYTANTHILTLNVESVGAMNCVVKDVSFDPVTDEVVHFDLLGVIEGQTLHIEVPITLTGTARGVSVGGGRLEHLLHRVQIECEPSALPEHIEVDVTNLEVGKSIRIGDLNIPGVKFMIDSTASIAVIHAKRGRANEAATAEADKS